MLYTMIQPQSSFGSGEDFLVFLPFMGMEAILFMVWKHSNKLSISFQQEAPCEIW